MQELDIAEIARLAGVTPSALRFYEKKGLIRSVGRHGLRRQYNADVVNKLALIALGQMAGFKLSEIAEMFDERGRLTLEPQRLLAKVEETESKIEQLKKISEGLKHVAGCTAPNHMQCPQFLNILQKALPSGASALLKNSF